MLRLNPQHGAIKVYITNPLIIGLREARSPF